jgi:hypothetical protein
MIGARSNIRRGVLASAFLLAVAACDFDVSNPGPVEDRILNDPTSHAAVVNGIARAVSDATNNHTLQTAAATRELHASGNTGTISVQIGQGLFQPEEGGLWSSAQRARWIGDDAVRRLTDVGATDATLAQAHLWAGFASRLAGANLCEAVIDGGAAQPHTVFLQRAVDHFTKAIGFAGTNTTLRNAAVAGRASVYVMLGNWAAATADAKDIPDNFVFQPSTPPRSPPSATSSTSTWPTLPTVPRPCGARSTSSITWTREIRARPGAKTPGSRSERSSVRASATSPGSSSSSTRPTTTASTS